MNAVPKKTAKATAKQIRARAESALADVRRRSEGLNGPRGKKVS